MAGAVAKSDSEVETRKSEAVALSPPPLSRLRLYARECERCHYGVTANAICEKFGDIERFR